MAGKDTLAMPVSPVAPVKTAFSVYSIVVFTPAVPNKTSSNKVRIVESPRDADELLTVEYAYITVGFVPPFIDRINCSCQTYDPGIGPEL